MVNVDKYYNPLAEVFGFPITNNGSQAKRYRSKQLCPYNNKVPNCTKDKAKNPLGVCSINHNNAPIITCPVRFRQDWIIIENAANFFFSKSDQWTSLSEIKLLDKNGQTAGNVDYVLVSYNKNGEIIDFGSLEVQGVYISGNLRNPFEKYKENPKANFSWTPGYNYPKPDYLSSSRKRLVPQMLYKGGIFKKWEKKQAVVLQKQFWDTLPVLPVVPEEKADIAWFIYDLEYNNKLKIFDVVLIEKVFTEFLPALDKIIIPTPGKVENFISLLQEKLDVKLDNPPDAPALNEIINNE
ncbi:MAG: NotI family restriction endonuclease [Candidatus Kapaibacterium sp.]